MNMDEASTVVRRAKALGLTDDQILRLIVRRATRSARTLARTTARLTTAIEQYTRR